MYIHTRVSIYYCISFAYMPSISYSVRELVVYVYRTHSPPANPAVLYRLSFSNFTLRVHNTDGTYTRALERIRRVYDILMYTYMYIRQERITLKFFLFIRSDAKCVLSYTLDVLRMPYTRTYTYARLSGSSIRRCNDKCNGILHELRRGSCAGQ